MTLHPRSMHLKFLPEWTRPLQPRVISPVLRLSTIGGLPPMVRRRFAIPWGHDDEVAYRALQCGLRTLFRNLPASRRYGPTATRGYRARQQRRRDQEADTGAAA